MIRAKDTTPPSHAIFGWLLCNESVTATGRYAEIITGKQEGRIQNRRKSQPAFYQWAARFPL
jgi:hypothetical protein